MKSVVLGKWGHRGPAKGRIVLGLLELVQFFASDCARYTTVTEPSKRYGLIPGRSQELLPPQKHSDKSGASPGFTQ